MKDIKIYSCVKTTKDKKLDDKNNTIIKAGSTGLVVEIVNHKGTNYYVVEINQKNRTTIIEDFLIDELEVIDYIPA